MRILHLEDDPLDSELARQILRQGGLEAEIDRVCTLDAMRRQLDCNTYALILSDYTLPGVDALDALQMVRQACPETPCIFLSGTLGEDVAIEALKLGATDYVLKQRIQRLVPAVRRALQEAEAQTRRRQAEKALRQSEERLRESEEKFRAVFEKASIGMGRVRFSDARWIDVNDAFCQMLGYSREEMLSTPWPQMTHPEDVDLDLLPFRRMAEGELDSYMVEKRFIHRQGHYVWSSLTLSLVRDDQGRPDYEIVVIKDITQSKQAEAALRASEERLKKAISIDTIGVLFFNLDGQIIDANPAFERMSGYSIEELRTTAHWETLTSPEFREVTYRTAESLATRGETAPYEKQLIRKDGSRWWGLFAPTRLAGTGRDSQCVEFIIEISERKQAEQELKELNEHLEERVAVRTAEVERERRRLYEMLETLPAMIALFTPDHHVTFANRQFREAFGEARGRPCHEYIFGNAQPCEFCQAYGVLETGQMVHWECPSPDGRKIIDVYNMPFIDADGSPLVLEMDLDITEQRQAQAALKDANAMLEQRVAERTAALTEAGRRKDEFLAMLAHELRNPLAPVRNAVQILSLAGPKEPLLQRQRDIIDRQVSHMARLLDDLLDVSRITRGKITLKEEEVKLTDVLARAVETVAPLVDAHQHTLSVALHSENELLFGDFDRLIQIVGNLLTNAAKYTENGGRIWLESSREHETIVIRVRDTGMGIAPDLLPKVFDVFTQAERSLDRSQGGLGLVVHPCWTEG